MTEKIGGAELIDTFFSGEEPSVDSTVEDELFYIAGHYREEELNRVIAERKSWPVLYHFSHIRRNIVDWMPIRKTDRVLEIGSDCGAVTGALAEKAGRTDCIELSRRRSLVNAYRNRRFDNIRIFAGNFTDIEKSLEEEYDYITLIGALESAKKYVEGADPWHELLARAAARLKPGGTLVIAIENKLGLKYFAGCTEDNIGKCFAGLEGYEKDSDVRTFSKKELQELIEGAGAFRTTFYYPYPDYKFPMTVYSDRFLPGEGELKEFFANYDRERIVLFSEPKVYDTVIRAGLFPEFSNSFLVTAKKEEP